MIEKQYSEPNVWCEYFQMSEIPYEILVLFAQAGGRKLAFKLAMTSKQMKTEIDECFLVDELIFPDYLMDRRAVKIGKFHCFKVTTLKAIESLPSDTSRIYFYGHHRLNEVAWPAQVCHLTLDYTINQPIHQLVWPVGLQRLHLGDKFDMPIHRVNWPAGLQHIKFGISFNQPIYQVQWPNRLQSLEFGRYFNQTLEDARFPVSLKQLCIGDHFQQSLHHIPFTLLVLEVKSHYSQHTIHDVTWPIELHTLVITGIMADRVSETSFPDSLRRLTLRFNSVQKLDTLRLPQQLEYLELGGLFDNQLPLFPNSLQHMRLNSTSTYYRFTHFPDSLRTLEFGDSFNQDLSDVQLPSALRVLIFGREFNQPVDEIKLPPHLEILKFGADFNQPMDHVKLPDSLCLIALGWEFRQPLENLKLPKSLQLLNIPIPYQWSPIIGFPLWYQKHKHPPTVLARCVINNPERFQKYLGDLRFMGEVSYECYSSQYIC